MKVTAEMFESGTFPPYAEVQKAGHEQFSGRLTFLLAKRKAAVLSERAAAKKKRFQGRTDNLA